MTRRKTVHFVVILKIPNVVQYEMILKCAREKCQVTYKGKLSIETSDYYVELYKGQEVLEGYISSLKENNYQSRLIYPEKFCFRIKGA
jgi:hypothetical protein